MKNIELFDYYAGVIFAELIDEFPLPQDIKIARIIKDEVINNPDDVNKHIAIAYNTGLWLRDNGFIKVDNSFSSVRILQNAILTHKGLELLKQIPPSLNGVSFADSIKNAVKLGKDEAIKESVNRLLSFSLSFIS